MPGVSCALPRFSFAALTQPWAGAMLRWESVPWGAMCLKCSSMVARSPYQPGTHPTWLSGVLEEENVGATSKGLALHPLPHMLTFSGL